MRTVIVDELDLRNLIVSGARFTAQRVSVDGSFKWSLTTYA